MDTLNSIKPATLKEAFGVEQNLNNPSTPNINPTETILELRKVALPPVENKKSIEDIFIDIQNNEYDIDEAEIFYPSKMNDPSEIPKEVKVEIKEVEQTDVQPFFMPENEVELSPNFTDVEGILEFEPSPFIVANTKEVTLHHLSNECIIPVFSKDNERTISHHEFIGTVIDAIRRVFPNKNLANPEIRISHEIKGRVIGV